MTNNNIDNQQNVSLYVVRSPLQLFNCYEASKRYADDRYKILLVLYRKEFDRDLMVKIIDEPIWNEVIITDFRSISVQLKLIASLLKKINSIGLCFLGDYTHTINMLINRRKPRQIVWIDDGVATLHRAKLLADDKFFTLDKHFHKKSRAIIFIEKLLRSDRDYLINAEFFTIYDSIRSYSSKFKIVSNDYQHFRKRCESIPVKDVVYFIGTDIRGEVLKNPEQFENYIASINQHYHGKDWRYILHRKENVDYMHKIAEKYGFVIEKFDRILEQQFAYQGWCPAEIATTCSSALDTLSVIYQPHLTAFLLKAEDVRDDQKIAIDELYSHYERINVKMLQI